MIINYSDNKKNTKTRVIFICDKCSKEDSRNMKKHFELLEKNPDFSMDYCKKCWSSIRQKTPLAKKRMSKAIKKMIKNDPEWKIKNSKSKKGKINLGENNGMKSEEGRKKLSETRSKMMANGYNKEVSKQMKKAWADGKFDGVRVGQCKWYTYNHSNGKKYKVQGKWELYFIEWLDKNCLEFTCHRGRIPYTLNENQHSYLPDFFVNDWNCYVDIKNDYHYSLQKDKFDSLKKDGHVIKIILKEELENLINRKL